MICTRFVIANLFINAVYLPVQALSREWPKNLLISGRNLITLTRPQITFRTAL